MCDIVALSVSKLKSGNLRVRAVVVPVIAISLISVLGVAVLTTPTAPYPSEASPLSLFGNGVKWTANSSLSPPYRYAGLWISLWLNDSSGSYVSWWVPNYENPLCNGSPVSYTPTLKLGGLCNTTLNITDLTGDGIFGANDSFVIMPQNGSSFAENMTYYITLCWGGPVVTQFKIYAFVIYRGAFYSWDATPDYWPM